jgi:hypothetical protein
MLSMTTMTEKAMMMKKRMLDVVVNAVVGVVGQTSVLVAKLLADQFVAQRPTTQRRSGKG